MVRRVRLRSPARFTSTVSRRPRAGLASPSSRRGARRPGALGTPVEPMQAGDLRVRLALSPPRSDHNHPRPGPARGRQGAARRAWRSSASTPAIPSFATRRRTEPPMTAPSPPRPPPASVSAVPEPPRRDRGSRAQFRLRRDRWQARDDAVSAGPARRSAGRPVVDGQALERSSDPARPAPRPPRLPRQQPQRVEGIYPCLTRGARPVSRMAERLTAGASASGAGWKPIGAKLRDCGRLSRSAGILPALKTSPKSSINSRKHAG